MAYTFKSKIKKLELIRAANNKTESLSSVEKRIGAPYIFNGGYYNMSTGIPETWLVINGKILATGNNGYGYAINGDKVVYSYQNNVNYPNFIGSAFRLIHNGKIDMIGGQTNKRGRTGMGLTASGEAVFYVAADTVAKDKLTSRELAEKLLSLGCVNGIELDGGGSTQWKSPNSRYSSGRAVSWWAAIWTEGSSMAIPVGNRPVLRRGSTGVYVRELQGLIGAVIDGSFGPATGALVRAFQRANGLVEDEIVGPLTWAALLNQNSQPVVKICPTCGQVMK